MVTTSTPIFWSLPAWPVLGRLEDRAARFCRSIGPAANHTPASASCKNGSLSKHPLRGEPSTPHQQRRRQRATWAFVLLQRPKLLGNLLTCSGTRLFRAETLYPKGSYNRSSLALSNGDGRDHNPLVPADPADRADPVAPDRARRLRESSSGLSGWACLAAATQRPDRRDNHAATG